MATAPATSSRRTKMLRTALGAVALSVALTAGLAGGAVGAAPARKPATELLDTGAAQVVFVHAPTVSQRNKVIALGVDYTEHATSRGIGVVLHGPAMPAAA